MRPGKRLPTMVPTIGRHYARRPLIMELMLWLMTLPWDLSAVQPTVGRSVLLVTALDFGVVAAAGGDGADVADDRER